ncbi:MAG: hypothetical protein ACE5HX_01955 [bacterium]
MKTIKTILFTITLFTLLAIQGCYFSEFIETRIFLSEDNKPAKIIINYQNISSGEAKTSDVRNDFDELIKDWKGDEYLLERAEERLFIKNREVFIQDDKVCARVTGIIKDLNDVYSFWVSNGERIMMFDDEDYELVESNGKILKTNKNTLIVWPDDARELYWKQRFTEESESLEKNRPLMVKWLQEYLATQPDSSRHN